MIYRLLDNEYIFPNPADAEEDGLLAIGGDLAAERLIEAYRNGIFPWFSEDDPILWYSPHQRCVIFPEKVRVSKTMRQVLQRQVFQVTLNQAFADVIGHCANTPREGQDGTWITNDMQNAYIQLHQLGYAQSVEVWQNGKLVGGLYGINMGKVFCGESMFSHASNASKMALIYLCQNMGFTLVDCQLPNDHLISMGAEMIGREEFMGFFD